MRASVPAPARAHAAGASRLGAGQAGRTSRSRSSETVNRRSDAREPDDRGLAVPGGSRRANERTRRDALLAAAAESNRSGGARERLRASGGEPEGAPEPDRRRRRRRRLSALRAGNGHRFLVDDVLVGDADVSQMSGNRQVTDAHLVALTPAERAPGHVRRSSTRARRRPRRPTTHRPVIRTPCRRQSRRKFSAHRRRRRSATASLLHFPGRSRSAPTPTRRLRRTSSERVDRRPAHARFCRRLRKCGHSHPSRPVFVQSGRYCRARAETLARPGEGQHSAGDGSRAPSPPWVFRRSLSHGNPEGEDRRPAPAQQGESDQAEQARQELPEQVDPERDSGLFAKFGIDPQDLLGKLGGGIPGL